MFGLGVLEAVPHVSESDSPVDEHGNLVGEERRQIDDVDGETGWHQDADSIAGNLGDGFSENHNGDNHLLVGTDALALVGKQDTIGVFFCVFQECACDCGCVVGDFDPCIIGLNEPLWRDGSQRFESVALSGCCDED